jgi:hypothetical protein
MASWLELLFNIIGYGGFVVLASCHHAADAVQVSSESGTDDLAGSNSA